MRDCVCLENSRSKPRSTVMLATTAMRIAGTAAITENRATIRMCSRDPARPRRRAWNTRQNSQPMTATRNRIVTALTHRSVFTTPSVGRIGVRLASTRKVTMAERSASPTATSPAARASHPAGGAAEGNSVVEACVISAIQNLINVVALWTHASVCRHVHEQSEAFLQQCCRIETNPGRNRISQAPLSAGSEHLNLQITDLLAQGIAVDPKQVSGANLIAPGGCQGHGQERMLDLA